jgi:hypothetical protein
MYQPLNEYMTLSQNERQSHLDLTEPCIELGANSQECRGLMAMFLKTTVIKSKKIHLCHACYNDKCNNSKHLYWGTPKENYEDGVKSGAHKEFWKNKRKVN